MKKRSKLDVVLDKLEIAGNKLPDPVTIFLILCISLFILSFICFKFKVHAVNPATNEIVNVNNLLEVNILKTYLSKIVNIFQTFPPLGVVLVSLIGIGLADKTGLLEGILQITVTKVPKNLLYATIAVMGIVFSGIGDAGFVILPPLAALIFIKIGKNPIAGVLLAFAGSAAGFSSGLFVGLNDILLTSFTIPAGQLLNTDFNASPAMTIFFNITNTFLQVIVLTFVTKKYIEPRFSFDIELNEKISSGEMDEKERKALKYAGITAILFIFIIIALSLGEKAFLRDENGSLVSLKSPFMSSLIPMMSLGFFLSAFVYGKTTGIIKNDKDVVKMVAESLSTMGGYIFIVFASAQFIYLFSESKLGIVLAIKGANLLKTYNLTGLPLIILYILLIAFINLFIGSASAKWAILSPIFVPMFMILGYDTALTQQAYRIGDSATNMLSPLFPYAPLLLSVLAKYDKKSGLGTLIANMIPYALASLVTSILLLAVFLIFNINLGL